MQGMLTSLCNRYSKLACLHRVKERKTPSLSAQASFAPFSLMVAWSGKSLITPLLKEKEGSSYYIKYLPLYHLTILQVTRTFKNVKQYLKRWEPLLKAEAATNAVLSGDNYWLKDVVINWTKEDEQYIGTLKLTTEFCTENQVFAVDMNRPTDEE